MRYITACSGIEAPTLAWHPLGWQPLAFSEIDPFPRAVLKHHYPTVPLHGDLTAVDWSEYRGRAELFAAGTPCQAFSIAGLRKGLADPRGNLTLAWLGAVDAARPRWLVWENVPGILSHDKGRTFGAFLGALGELGYGFAYRVLDAQYFKLAQRRSRVFLVGYLGDWRPAAAVLFERQSLSGHPAPRRQARARVAGSVNGVSPGGGWRIGSDEAAAGQLVAGSLGASAAGPDDNDARDGRLIAGTINANGKAAGSATQQDAESGMLVAGTIEASAGRSRGAGTPPAMLAFGGNDTRGSIDVATAVNAHGGPHGRLDFESETFIAYSLRADGFDASEDGTGRGCPLVPVAYQGHDSNVGPMGALRCGTNEAQGVPFIAAEVIPFDTTQITSAVNRSNPAPGDPAGTLAKGGHAPAVAFQSKASASQSMNPSDISPGIDVGKGDGLSTFAPGYGVRRLTPRECERLMGMPEIKNSCIIKVWLSSGRLPSDAPAAASNLRSRTSASHAEGCASAPYASAAETHSIMPHQDKGLPVALRVFIDLERSEVRISKAERSSLYVIGAADLVSYHHPVPRGDFALAVAAMLDLAATETRDGRAASLLPAPHSPHPQNGSASVSVCGRDVEELAEDAEKLTSAARACSRFITLRYGRNSQTCGSTLATLSCFVMAVIAGFIPSEIRKTTSYSVEIETVRGYTNVPYNGRQLAADGPRYKAIGNSQAVPCLRWIGERIEAVERILAEHA